MDLDYQICFWHTRNKVEVDFVLYGPKGFLAIEVKGGSRLREKDFEGLKLFKEDYPQAKCFLVYGGQKTQTMNGVTCVPAEKFLVELDSILSSG